MSDEAVDEAVRVVDWKAEAELLAKALQRIESTRAVNRAALARWEQAVAQDGHALEDVTGA